MPAGRPKIELSPDDWERAEKMAYIQCTGREIANVLQISYDTLERRIKEKGHPNFADWFDIHSAGGKMSLRRKQFKMAEHNASMAIWLGKQYLNQRDKSDVNQSAQIIQVQYTDGQIEEALKAAREFKEQNE